MDQAKACILLHAIYIMDTGSDHARPPKPHYTIGEEVGAIEEGSVSQI